MLKTGEILMMESATTTGCGTGAGASCSVPQNGQAAACGCQSEAAILTPDQITIRPVQSVSHHQVSRWQSVRSGVMFVIACVASPCCTPLIVSIVLGLIAGTPLAAWMGHNLGLIYGVLTLLSVISFVLALRWMKTDPRKRPSLQSINKS